MIRDLRSRISTPILTLFLVLSLAYSAPAHADEAAEPTFSSEQLDHFEKNVRPILAEHCYSCHSAKSKKLQASLRVDGRAALLAGGDSGAAIVPGDAEESLLIQAVHYDAYEMPPKGKLSDSDIEALVKWVEDGVAWPPGEDTGEAVGPAKFDWKQRKADHWSWQPLAKATPPATASLSDPKWPQGSIDAFVLRQLDKVGMNAAEPADRRMLLRRIYFDLIGLPPTREQIAAFLADDQPGAYERVVDELLASPHFGEKWARHWLDLMRYAESYGHEFDYPIPHAWRFRDYVIDAFNDDVPYDQFVREHLAGDLLDSPRRHAESRLNQSIVGTGFWFLGEATHAPTDVLEDQATRIENQIDVACRSFMGLSVSCARCHDHKFDPISTADYYSLSGVMQSSRRHIANLYPEGAVETVKEKLQVAGKRAQTQFDKGIAAVDFDGERLAKFLAAALDAEKDASEANLEGWTKEVATKWQAALRSESSQQITHPMWVWNRLADWNVNQKSPEAVAKRLSELQSDVSKKDQSAQEAAADWRIIRVDNDSSEDEVEPAWYADGPAFEPSQTGDVSIRESGWSVIAEPGMIAGRLDRKFTGVVRSQSFTLDEKGQVRFRMRGKGARVQLVIHGYYMAPFNGLLFGRTIVSPKELGKDQSFRWHTLGNDLQKNREAHIEVTVAGGATAEIGEIRVTKGDAKRLVDPPHAWSVGIAKDEAVDSVASLAQSFGKRWDECRERWATGESTVADAQFVNWLLQDGLLPLPKRYQKQLKSLELSIASSATSLPAPMKVMAIAEGTPFDSPIAIRGKAANQGELVPRRLPVAMSGEDQSPVSGSGRLEMANRMLADENPFTARVEVNRLWHHLFGRGIVSTVCDFGEMGQPPSHPELLDWLAEDFRTHGWSRKRMIRQMVTSQTYRMSSVAADPEQSADLDPNNQWLHRMSVRRLTAEAIRDQVLHVSKKLKPKVGGDSVNVFLTPFMNGRGKPKGGPRDSDGRRSLYISIRRNFLPTDLLAYDFPKPLSSIGTRTRSNVPAQSLFMMNNPLVREHAELLAKNLVEEHAGLPERMNALFETVIGLPPSATQLEECESFLAAVADEHDVDLDNVKPWSELCHVVFNMKDFIFLR